MEEPKRKEQMSEEERAELARKLDEDLDQFMETMAAQSVIAAIDKPGHTRSFRRKTPKRSRLTSTSGAKSWTRTRSS